MAPLVVMIVGWALFRLLGLFGLDAAATWTGALRFALAAMFAFTAMSHFHPRTRPDLIAMVPGSLPAAGLLVSITGVLELLGAIGLLVPATSRAAAYALMALLVVRLPLQLGRIGAWHQFPAACQQLGILCITCANVDNDAGGDREIFHTARQFRRMHR